MSLQTDFQTNKKIAEFIGGLPDEYSFSEEEIALINQYKGFGGMAKLDDNLNAKQILYEYYTPIELVEIMVGLAIKHGYTDGSVVEPSCGIGRFLHYFNPKTAVDAYEPDYVSYRIAKANFPTFNIHHQTFNEIFVDRKGKPKKFKNDYSLVIGNPPYGAFIGRNTSVEKRKLHVKTYVDYFVTRGLDLLKAGGLLVYIIPSNFLDNKEDIARKLILSKAELIDAYRLPKKVFDHTDIQTDIIVMRKLKKEE